MGIDTAAVLETLYMQPEEFGKSELIDTHQDSGCDGKKEDSQSGCASFHSHQQCVFSPQPIQHTYFLSC